MYIDGKWVDVKPSQREGNVGKGGRSSAKIGPKGKYIKLVGSRNINSVFILLPSTKQFRIVWLVEVG